MSHETESRIRRLVSSQILVCYLILFADLKEGSRKDLRDENHWNHWREKRLLNTNTLMLSLLDFARVSTLDESQSLFSPLEFDSDLNVSLISQVFKLFSKKSNAETKEKERIEIC